jgi:hypothetical protein
MADQHEQYNQNQDTQVGDPFQQIDQEQENTPNQPALRMGKVGRQRDMGTGKDVGTAPGVDSEDSYKYAGPAPVGPGADPHAGAGTGTSISTGQYRGSDEGTSTEQGSGR